MTEQKSNYRHILKATSLFGGVQVIGIIINMIQSKFIAVLLGPEGMGISGLLKSTVGLVEYLTNFGIGKSAVRNVAAANATGDSKQVATVIIVLRRCVWVTGLLGAIITLVLSKYLSEVTFGNSKYTLAFAWLSVTLILNQLSNGQFVVLTGLQKLKQIANANITGSAMGMLISLPLFYFYGVDGIVPSIILGSVAQLLRSWYFSRKVEIEKVEVSREQTLAEGKQMLSMGFMISLSGLFTIASFNIIRIFIGRHGGIADVGLYNAGHTITKTYVGMIFGALTMDFYPRLSAIAQDNELARKTINQQVEIILLIIAPMLVFFLVYIDWAIELLYSTKFLSINTMINWMAFGTFFRAACWPVTYIFLAKGNKNHFVLNELVSNIYSLLFNIIGFYLGGLTGLGISFAVGYLAYLLQLYLVTNKLYDFSFDDIAKRIFIIQLIVISIAFFLKQNISHMPLYIIGLTLALFSSYYSYRELDKRIGIKELLKRRGKNSKK